MTDPDPRIIRLPDVEDLDPSMLAGLSQEDAEGLAAVARLIAAEADPDFRRMPVELGPLAAFLIVSSLQLTLTYPALPGHLAEHLARLGRQLQGAFHPDSPTYKVLERGWQRTGDAGEVLCVDLDCDHAGCGATSAVVAHADETTTGGPGGGEDLERPQ